MFSALVASFLPHIFLSELSLYFAAVNIFFQMEKKMMIFETLVAVSSFNISSRSAGMFVFATFILPVIYTLLFI